MARPSLPAAIAPFRGCPAGCLRVACETLLSPSAQKGRMNNGPRQALALNNPSLCFTLCLTFSVSKSNHKLFPQNPHSSIHPISSVSSHFPQHKLFSLIRSSLRLPSLLPQNLRLVSHPFLFASTLLVFRFGNTKTNTLNQGEGEHEAPHIFLGSQDPIWPSYCPNHQNVGDSSSITMSHPNHLSIFEKALLDLYCLKGLGPNSESEWTKQLLVWLIAYLSGTKLQLTVI